MTINVSHKLHTISHKKDSLHLIHGERIWTTFGYPQLDNLKYKSRRNIHFKCNQISFLSTNEMEQRIISQFYCFVLVFLFGFCLRALTLGNAKVKCKENLAFQASKCSASGNAKFKYCKFFAILLQCNYIFRIVL